MTPNPADAELRKALEAIRACKPENPAACGGLSGVCDDLHFAEVCITKMRLIADKVLSTTSPQDLQGGPTDTALEFRSGVMAILQDWYPNTGPRVRDCGDAIMRYCLKRYPAPTEPGMDRNAVIARDDRQRRVHEWCSNAFGADHAASVEQRGLRLLEEAVEAYQACGCSPEQAHKLVDYIFAKPADPLARELGGVGITLLALAQAAGLSADEEESRELERVLAKPLEHFAKRNRVKNDAGFSALKHPLTSPPAKPMERRKDKYDDREMYGHKD